jgi:hypothetical protein
MEDKQRQKKAAESCPRESARRTLSRKPRPEQADNDAKNQIRAHCDH